MQKKSTSKNPPPKRSSKPNTRRQAAAMLTAIERGKTSDEASDRLDGLATIDRGLAKAMVMLALRHRGEIAALLARYLKRAVPARPHLAKALLSLGVVQICYMDIPSHAGVSETVEACGRAEQPYRGLINAVLRKLAGQTTPERDVPDNPALNMPDWMMTQWTQSYGADTAHKIAEMHRRQPPLDICFKTPLLAKNWLAHNHEGAIKIDPTHIRLAKAGRIEDLAGFETGDWWVQDVAAGFIAQILMAALPKGDMHVLDLCAAPGGKTLQIAAAGHQVTALDVSRPRIQRLQENLQRTSLRAKIIHADALDWEPDSLFDAILLDAPCSATGTIRRHPDLPLHRRKGYTPKLTALQDALLARAAKWLKPNGIFVYATCSLDPEEGECRIEQYLKRHLNFSPLSLEKKTEFQKFMNGHELRTTPIDMPDIGGMDGFYAALLQHRLEKF